MEEEILLSNYNKEFDLETPATDDSIGQILFLNSEQNLNWITELHI